MGHFLHPRNTSLTVSRWIDEYGPVGTIRLGFQAIVIIGRCEAAMDIIKKQGIKLIDLALLLYKFLHANYPSVCQTLGTGSAGCVEHSIRISSPIQLRHIGPCRCHTRKPRSSIFLTIYTTFRTTWQRLRLHPPLTPKSGKLTSSSGDLKQYCAMVITLVDLIPWLRYLPRYAPELKDGHRPFIFKIHSRKRASL